MAGAGSEWTVDTLKAYVDQRLSDNANFFMSMAAERQQQMDRRFGEAEKTEAAALRAAQQAVDKAERATERRFEAVNEFRAQLEDQAATFISRKEVDLQIRSLSDMVRTNSSRLDALGGSSLSGQRYLTTAISMLAALGAVGAIIAVIVH